MSEKLLDPEAQLDTTIMAEVQLLLAEKRTSLATLRTGIAIFAFPLSVLSLLVATSSSYRIHEVMHWIIPLVIINAGLVVLAVYLIFHALRRLRRYDVLIDEYKRKYNRLAKLLG